jgi:hypothetical protein
VSTLTATTLTQLNTNRTEAIQIFSNNEPVH